MCVTQHEVQEVFSNTFSEHFVFKVQLISFSFSSAFLGLLTSHDTVHC